MPKSSDTFGVTLTNVPIVNLRSEFRTHLKLARELRLLPPRRKPVQTPYLVWLGMPASGITLILVRSLLSLEAYMSFAAEFGGAVRGLLTPEFKRACRNPFVLGRRGTADNYYNRLPGLIAADLPMPSSAPKTWLRTKRFYAEIRNPLFHGHELQNLTAENVRTVFDQIADVYRWIDGWFDPEEFMPGAKQAFSFE